MGGRCWAGILVFVLLVYWTPCLHSASVGWEYAVIIDAGSTGSRVHVYRYYTQSTVNPWAAVELPEAVYKTTPGLSSYAFDPKTAANSLQPLLKFAKQKVPSDQWASTPIQLMATAGLRMLKNGSAEAILGEVRTLLASSGFEFAPGSDGARVLSGSEEGLWGWVAINYATGALQAATTLEVPSPSQLLLGRKETPGGGSSSSSSSSMQPPPAAPVQGVLELGGASMQVTFMPKEQLPVGQAAELVLPRLGPDRVYSHSFDGLGLQAAMASWASKLAADGKKKDPCLPNGYTSNSGVVGVGDWGACLSAVKQLVPLNGSCLYKRCGIGGTFLPTVDGAVFLGLDNFYYTAHLLGLPTSSRISIKALEKAAKGLCSSSWRDVRAKYVKHGSHKDPYVLKACFSSALIVSLLRDGLHINPDAAVLTASNSVTTPKGATVEVNWALGALIVEVLQLGGRALSRAHDHLMLAQPGSGQGASDATAAAVAATFCLLMLALSSCASYFRLGVTAAAMRRISLSSISLVAIAPGSSASSAAAAAAGGGSTAKYTRMRAVSPTMYSNGDQQRLPVSTSANSIENAAYFQGGSSSSDRRTVGGISSSNSSERRTTGAMSSSSSDRRTSAGMAVNGSSMLARQR